MSLGPLTVHAHRLVRQMRAAGKACFMEGHMLQCCTLFCKLVILLGQGLDGVHQIDRMG